MWVGGEKKHKVRHTRHKPTTRCRSFCGSMRVPQTKCMPTKGVTCKHNSIDVIFFFFSPLIVSDRAI